ncbi:MAG: CYTH domain-containing protein [Verrucomicrobia bacterium]|nr:CYTH domain-containing protein [Verrucomicrobiota bacterium]
MGIEIERKFLVEGDAWKAVAGEGLACRQGYLDSGKGTTTRVRIIGERAYLTIKGATSGITRSEFEYEIPVPDAESLLALCGAAIIEKKRHFIKHAGMVWELDVFSGANTGLVMAEIELETEGQPFILPEWTGEEVSADPRYRNAHLARHPFSEWGAS